VHASRRRLAGVIRALTWTCVAILLGTAVYYLVLAVGPSGIGPQPGDGPPGETVAAAAWILASLAGGVLAVVYVVRPGLPGPVYLIAPASAACLIAAFYDYDPYYAPELQRYAEGRATAVNWNFFVLGIAIAVGAIALRARRLGAALTPLVLLVVLVSAAATGGH